MPFLTFFEDYNLLWGMSAEPQEIRSSHNMKILNFRTDINIFWYLAMCMNFEIVSELKNFVFVWDLFRVRS